MACTVLITGGAGFVGSHVAEELLRAGHSVRVLDNLSAEQHGVELARPPSLGADVELVVGDVRNRAVVRRALHAVDAVVHLAAAPRGEDGSPDVAHVVSVNHVGTAVVLDEIARSGVCKVVVVSDRRVYGEGLCCDRAGVCHEATTRSPERMARGDFEPRSVDGELLESIATPETKRPNLETIHAATKYGQERLCLLAGRVSRVPTVVLRAFDVYGPGQPLAKPRGGVLGTFAWRVTRGARPIVFEDGMQRRDFTSVHDVARAIARAVVAENVDGLVVNVGSGVGTSLRDAAALVARAVNRQDLAPEITGKHRAGDVRACFADLRLAARRLGYEPRVPLAKGLEELVAWASERAHDDGPSASLFEELCS